KIASPALLLKSPALFEFAEGIILNVPAWAKGLQGRKAIGEPAGTHQGSWRLLGQLQSGHIPDEAGPQAGIRCAIASSRLDKALPSRQLVNCCDLHLAYLLVALDRAQIAMVRPIDELPIG